MRAFILANARDAELAVRCSDRMASLGWRTTLLDRDYSQGRGMYGNACAKAILADILDGSEDGETVLKMDCDVWLSPEASQWFAGVTHKARACRLQHRVGTQVWGGVWGAALQQVARARAIDLPPCRCPESYLCLRALHLTGGLEIRAPEVITDDASKLGFASTWPIGRLAKL